MLTKDNCILSVVDNLVCRCNVSYQTRTDWEFGKGVDSARGVDAIVVFCRNHLYNTSCDAKVRRGRKLVHSSCYFECNSLFAIVRVKGRSKQQNQTRTGQTPWEPQ